MINKTKVTDGDLIFVTLEGDVDQLMANYLKTQMESWLKDKGFNNCKVMISGGDGIKINLNILTVNDVFEDEVLKGEGDG